MHHKHIDLADLAKRTLIEAGFEPEFESDAQAQAAAVRESEPQPGNDTRDLRALLWSSIDNDDSRDLDQVEYAECLPDGSIRVLVGVADVDYLVPIDSPIDHHAWRNTASIYTGVRMFPMLPERLSTDLTSLLPAGDRLAIVTDMVVAENGEVQSGDIYRAVVRNKAKLVYEEVGAWLEGAAEPPDIVAAQPELQAQLRLQDEAAQLLRTEREKRGALDLETIEAKPVVKDGDIADLTVQHKSRARYIIENFMVAANGAMARFLESQDVPSLQRVVREPRRWSRIVDVAAEYGARLPAAPDAHALSQFLSSRHEADPEQFPDLSLTIVKLLGPGEYAVVRNAGDDIGHFGLAVEHYTHSTAPNRRFADLVTQRVVKSLCATCQPAYTENDLVSIAAHCNERANAARKVERRIRKALAAVLLGRRIGDTFEAIVTGATDKGTYVRLLKPPAEGRVVKGEEGLDVGDRVKVRLLHTDVERGFIDFARVR